MPRIELNKKPQLAYLDHHQLLNQFFSSRARIETKKKRNEVKWGNDEFEMRQFFSLYNLSSEPQSVSVHSTTSSKMVEKWGEFHM